MKLRRVIQAIAAWLRPTRAPVYRHRAPYTFSPARTAADIERARLARERYEEEFEALEQALDEINRRAGSR